MYVSYPISPTAENGEKSTRPGGAHHGWKKFFPLPHGAFISLSRHGIFMKDEPSSYKSPSAAIVESFEPSARQDIDHKLIYIIIYCLCLC